MTTVLEVKKRLSAVWHKQQDKSETYEFDLAGDTAWACTRKNSSGDSRFKLSYDPRAERLSWGQGYFLDAADLVAKPNQVGWYRSSDQGKKKIAFTWLKVREVPLQVQARAQTKTLDKSSIAVARPQATAGAPAKWQEKSPTLSMKDKAAASSPIKSASDKSTPHESSAGEVAQSRGRPGRASPEMILNLKYIAVIYKPPGWICELPNDWSKDTVDANRGTSKDQILLRWVREKILDIDEGLYEEDFNPAMSGTGFGPLAHRIDGETSGCLLIAKTGEAQRHLKAQFHKTKVSKRYICLVHGHVKARQGLIDASIRTVRTDCTTRSEVSSTGEWAETKYEVIATYRAGTRSREASGYSLVACDITSGRTHQIRVHMLHLGHPLVSDAKYLSTDVLSEDRTFCPRLFLHSYRMLFKDMDNEDKLVICPLPDDLKQAVMSRGAAENEMEDCLFGETSWQTDILRPSLLQWRPGTSLQRKLAGILGQESDPMRLNLLNGMPELRDLMSAEGMSGIGKPWLMKNWEIFEMIPEPDTGDVCVRLRAKAGDDAVLGIDLDRQIESVQSELETLQQKKQRAIAQEEYQQAAEIKRRMEAVSQQLQSLVALRAEYLRDAEVDENGEGGLEGGGAAGQVFRPKERPKADAFRQDVKDESLFPSLGGPAKQASGAFPSLGASTQRNVASVAVRAASRTRSRDRSVDSRAPSVDSRAAEESADESAVQVDLKDALKEFLMKREGFVAHINEINNDRYLRSVLKGQIPKPMTAVTKGWLTFHEEVFVILRSQDQDMYVALEMKHRPQAEKDRGMRQHKEAKEQKATPAYHQVVQQMPGSAAPALVYDYSAAAQKETTKSAADGTSEWTDLFTTVLNREPLRYLSIDALLEAVPQFAKSMGARKINEQRTLLLMFLQGCGESFTVKKEGFGPDRKTLVYVKS